jgi:hypothetical protein
MSELLNTESLRETAEEYNKNFKWFMNNQERVKSKFRGKFVAIHNGSIFASDEHENLLKVLKAAGITKTDSVFKTYIPETDDVLMIMKIC